MSKPVSAQFAGAPRSFGALDPVDYPNNSPPLEGGTEMEIASLDVHLTGGLPPGQGLPTVDR